MDILDVHLGDNLFQYRPVKDVSSIISKAGIATEDSDLHVTSSTYWKQIFVIMEGKGAHYWTCGATKYLSKECPRRNPVLQSKSRSSKETVGSEKTDKALNDHRLKEVIRKWAKAAPPSTPQYDVPDKKQQQQQKPEVAATTRAAATAKRAVAATTAVAATATEGAASISRRTVAVEEVQTKRKEKKTGRSRAEKALETSKLQSVHSLSAGTDEVSADTTRSLHSSPSRNPVSQLLSNPQPISKEKVIPKVEGICMIESLPQKFSLESFI